MSTHAKAEEQRIGGERKTAHREGERAQLPGPSRLPNATEKLRCEVGYVGVNIGALSVKVVALRGERVVSRMVNHLGAPLAALERLLASKEFAAPRYVGVSGHLGHVSEVAAIERALEEVEGDFDAIASLGGESFLVYVLSGNRVLTVLSHNKCAAGSGEFFIQQIGRMGLGIEEAIERSFSGKVVPLASRCSVHCKSDITHKLNRQEASVEDILHTLHDSMANKVVSLLEKTQRDLKRVLVIGGVARNPAMLAALRKKLSGTEVVALEESPYFEAFGTALLTRDEPRYGSPQLSVKPTLDTLPPLERYRDEVQVIAAPPREVAVRGPLILGVDAGSTTTKAVLFDTTQGAVVAAHYGRTRGDPVAATKECLHSLIDQVGNRRVALVATTGSAREVAGAYLGTEHAYNEISAQAAGAAHYDPDVDTIFEIGGQDSKYIRLERGVPIDYAMNAACSAGTGSFLEESAQSDLGIRLDEIAEVALVAKTPVQFKATCAAFINSDVRIALQEGYSRDDITAGLVYAIANNYLTKVKGPRGVGNKVFLQGGVALNRAVGHAFAHSVGRPIVIPPHPELLGAQGVALLARERAKSLEEPGVDLASLAAPAMRLIDRFTCKACKLYCTIDRFEVAGRRFPFGGRCSLYESVWKRKSRTRAARDLVEERGALVFSGAGGERGAGRVQIGVPRALTAHSLYPLYSTFFSRLGMDVVLSGVDPEGELKSHSGFCYPAQIAHGAVLDLARRNVGLVFLPHVARMPNPSGSKDSYLCPITQASPFILAKAFPGMRFLSPTLDFTEGYGSSPALVDMAVTQLGASHDVAERAFRAAVEAQVSVERSLHELGRQALERAVQEGKPAVLLVGRSYNAFTPEASQSVGKKLASMGVTVIPSDCLAPVMAGPTSWHFPNSILNAVALAKRHPNLFILHVGNFSCTIDSFTNSALASELGAKPYLMLEIDAHTADAGVQTRLEAFMDIVNNYRQVEDAPKRSFTPSRLERNALVTTSSGARVPLSDPRVKLYLPTFSNYHSRAWAMAVDWLGLHAGPAMRLHRGQLERGLRYTSGRECLPLPICVGQLLEVQERRAPGEISGLYMLRGGAPCVTDAFMSYFERFIEQNQIPDLFVFAADESNDYCGIGLAKIAEHLTPVVTVADILVEIEQTLRVVGKSGGLEQLKAHWESFVESATSLEEFDARLPWLVDRLSQIPLVRDPATCPRVVVTGDFFTRFSAFFMEGVPERYAEYGIILKPTDLNELVLYVIYDGLAGAARDWGVAPGLGAVARACATVFQPESKNYLDRWMGYRAVKKTEEQYRRRFHKTGLLVAHGSDLPLLFRRASKHVSPAIFGELLPTVGKGLEAESEGYDGIILIGPFNCLPFRISEAVLKPLSQRSGMPILTYESDGYTVSPSFLRQVDVHIQQVLKHAEARSSTAVRAV